MKNLKLFSVFMLLSLCTLAFVSCEKEEESKDSSTKELTAKDIEGDWVFETRSESYHYWFGNGEFEHEFLDLNSYYMEEYYGTYTVSDNKLKLTFDDGDKITYSISLKGDILTIEDTDFERQ